MSAQAQFPFSDELTNTGELVFTPTPVPSGVTFVSRQAYAVIYATLAKREQTFLDALDDFMSKHQAAPTLLELTKWAANHGLIPDADPNFFRPRATALVDRGVCRYLDSRPCTYSAKMARPIAICRGEK